MKPLRLHHRRRRAAAMILSWLLLFCESEGRAQEARNPVIRRTIVADVVAFDQPYCYNRLGARAPDGMIYALKRDVVDENGDPLPADASKFAGKVHLRSDKRPRPLVLRMNVGDVLKVVFTNLLQNPFIDPKTHKPALGQSAPTRYAGLSVFGLELVDEQGKPLSGREHSGSFVGGNPTSLASPEGVPVTPPAPGQTALYRFYAPAEGTYLIASYADTTGTQVASGLFGAVNVQPEGAEYYRSQVTAADLRAATYRPVRRAGDTYGVPGEEFLRISELKTDAETLLAGQPGAELEAASPAAVRPTSNPRLRTLTEVNPLRRSTLTAKVEITPDGRLLGETGHPLINYQAVYPPTHSKAGIPVLSMLQAVTGSTPAFQIATSDAPAPGKVANATRDLEGGIISQELRAQFKPPHELSERATVTDEDGAAWLITDVGSTAYVVKTGTQPNTLDVYTAKLTLVYSDLTAVITGPNAERFPTSHNSPSFNVNSAYPDRRQPYREYTIIYHQASPQVIQAFPQFSATSACGYIATTLSSGEDGFGINYGIAGIAAEILANRIGVGPMGRPDAVDLKYEEFFLSAWAVGDPAMVVNRPANTDPKVRAMCPPKAAAEPATATTAALVDEDTARPRTGQVQRRPGRYEAAAAPPMPPGESEYAPVKNLYPDDPSNVYHSYMRDHVKFRVLHAGGTKGGGPSHIHHLHAHQWLHTPNSDTSTYLDSQLIIPGVAYTMEIAYGGSGNRNLTVGDSIFHCHFYPHFASGMWSLWRVHDTFEAGTELDSEGYPAADSRALPDGEIETGTPIPAVVPLPTLGMAPLPAKVRLIDGGRRVEVQPALTPGGAVVRDKDGAPVYDRNPGYPFFIPGYAGHRPPHPPLDLAWKEDPKKPGHPLLENGKKHYLDGGLRRHLVLGGEIVRQFQTRWDFSKDFILYNTEDKTAKDRHRVAGLLRAFQVPEDGTAVEKVTMATHSQRTHKTIEPNGFAGTFTLNGQPPVSGAPYAAPDVDDQGNSNNTNTRRYKAAVLQMDVVQTKKGWHFPQQRFLTLWGDVRDTVSGIRPPEPFFFRSSTGDTVEFWHTNLVPSYYELDDFQVRTPTDILGQHIHLVKFDVTSSDGAANGFNYEDGTFSPDEVRERIDAINAAGGLYDFDRQTQFYDPDPKKQIRLHVADYKADYEGIFGDPPPYQNWNGAQTTIQRFDTDPLLNNTGVDRTLRTVFTHDHFGPSTHQQVGLYAGMLIEPQNSTWYLPDGTQMNTRFDGGPTSWNGYIVPANPAESYREFAIEFQDTQLAYDAPSTLKPTVPPAAVFSMDQKTVQPLLPEVGSITVPAEVRKLFAEAGITLSSKATVAVEPTPAPAVKRWKITNPLVEKPIVPTEPQVWVITTETPPLAKPNPPQPKLFVELDPKNPAMNRGWSDPQNAFAWPSDGNNANNGPPYPQLISVGGQGVMSMNYRSEPVPLRLANPTSVAQPGTAVDPAFVYRSDIKRLDPDLSVQPTSFDMDVKSEKSLDQGQVDSDVRKAFLDAGVPLAPGNESTVAVVTAGQEWNITSTPTGGRTAIYAIRKLTSYGDPTEPKVPRLYVFTAVPGSKGNSTESVRFFPPPLVPISTDPKDGGVTGGDPFTPLLRAYANDQVQIRTLVGAHLTPHSFQVHGITWRTEPSDPNSGYRNAQTMGLSEHFEMLFTMPPATTRQEPTPPSAASGGSAGEAQPCATSGPEPKRPFADYWYAPSSDPTGQANGLWGLLRAYDQEIDQKSKAHLKRLPSNRAAGRSTATLDFEARYNEAEKAKRSTSKFDITAIAASQCLDPAPASWNPPAGTRGVLIYNERAKIYDATATLFVLTDDLEKSGTNQGKLKSGVPREPLILRVHAGDWIKLTIRNAFDGKAPAFPNSMTIGNAAAAPLNTPSFPVSTNVGIHPSLVAYDVRRDDGANVGYNPTETIEANPDGTPKCRTVYWYAGNLELRRHADGTEYIQETPIELGGVNLVAADTNLQRLTGLYATLIVEPRGSQWREDQVPRTRASAVVTQANGTAFREFVVLWQNDVENFSVVQPPQTLTSWGAVNYRSEPFSARNFLDSNGNPKPPEGYEAAFSNSVINATDPDQRDPKTPIFKAPAKMATRFRMLYPGGSTNNSSAPPAILVLQAHNWPEEPFVAQGRRIGLNPLSQRLGAQEHSAYEALNIVLPRAGGYFGVAGDYLYQAYMTDNNNSPYGLWGLFRVQNGGAFIARAFVNSLDQLTAEGSLNPNDDGSYAKTIDIKVQGNTTPLTTVPVDPTRHTWRLDASAGVTLSAGSVIVAEPPALPTGGQLGTPVTTPVVVPKVVD